MYLREVPVVPHAKDFEHVGSTVQEDGGSEKEVVNRIQSDKNSWKNVTGVLWETYMSA